MMTEKRGLFLRIGMTVMAAAFVTLTISACAPQPQGAILIYKVDPMSVADAAKVDMEDLTRLVSRRVNRRDNLAYVGRVGNRQIAVGVIHQNDVDKQRVKRLLAQTGTLEFRILANNRDNKDLIKQALDNPSKSQILDSQGNRLAWWVPVNAGAEKNLAKYPDIARHTIKQDGQERMKILVVKDDCDVSGAYLTHAEVGTDCRGQPCIDIAFSKTGGQLFGQLTSDHLPDNLTDFTYRLGIILNGELYSAPSIQATFYDRAQITGSFTEQEVEDFVSVLSAGAIPRLRLVETRSPP